MDANTLAQRCSHVLTIDESARISKCVEQLIDEQNALPAYFDKHLLGLSYQRIVYWKPGQKYSRNLASHIHEVDNSLVDKIKIIASDTARKNADTQEIKQVLQLVFRYCKDAQDVVDVLPKSVGKHISKHMPELALEKKKKDGFCVVNNQMLFNQYINICGKMECFTVTNLFL